MGVTIDNKLTWKNHTEKIVNKLKSMIAVLMHITPFIASDNYKSLYHTLFESHMAYCISVWGKAPVKSTDTIFRLQKKCLRILFGDHESFLDKFSTAARTRPFGKQKLGSDFYSREHTKPLMTKYQILTFHNLYKYFAINEIMKILKLKSPYSIHNKVTLSRRNNANFIILPRNKTNQFLFKASIFWNITIKKLLVPNINELSIPVFKGKLKSYILKIQNSGDPDIWNPSNILYN